MSAQPNSRFLLYFSSLFSHVYYCNLISRWRFRARVFYKNDHVCIAAFALVGAPLRETKTHEIKN